MRTVAATLIALGAMASATPVLAQAVERDYGFYANLGYTRLDSGDDVGGEGIEASFDAATARVGVRQGPVGAELEGSFGLGSETARVEGVDIELTLPSHYAAYVVGYVPVSENLELFARLGFGQVRLQAKVLGVEEELSEKALAFGGGAQYFFGGGLNGIRADYTRLELGEEEKDGEDLDGSANMFSVAYVRRF